MEQINAEPQPHQADSTHLGKEERKEVMQESPVKTKREGQTGIGACNRDINVKNEEDSGLIEFIVVRNDKTLENMRHMIDLKNIIAKQLPRMPRPYIVRLMMDRVHEAMIIIKKQPNKRPIILGGCVFRPFYSQKFAEIVFLAITTNEQVKGYGTRLMNKLKDHAQKKSIHYFLTYADNNAIEYFRKQGFMKCPTLPEARWKGFIKDYNGSTMMQCVVHREIKHETIYGDIRKQRDAIIGEILKVITLRRHQGLKFEPRPDGGFFDFEFSQIPGLKSAGWDHKKYALEKQADERSQTDQCQEIIHMLVQHENSWPFRKPVDSRKVRDYLEIIKQPIDLETIQRKVDQSFERALPPPVEAPASEEVEGPGVYLTVEDFKKDITLMFDNARTYNQQETIYYKYANQLELLIKPMLNRLRDHKKVVEPVVMDPAGPVNDTGAQLMQVDN